MSSNEQIQELADSFSRQWRSGENPDIGEFMSRLGADARSELLKVLIPIDVQLRFEAGQSLDASFYRHLGEDAVDIAAKHLQNQTNPEFSQTRVNSIGYVPVATQEISREIGPYRLRSKLGEGGMGEVWLADQEVPVKRQVAIKVIKNGTGSREVLTRFEVERQSLAMMNHPNISRILDAGSTRDGLPYFAMELVVGKPITTYCDENNLGIDERLRLFRDVCSGVQHAHQKGIIHRDLKPANILVTVLDGVATPKVIDFGLAKAIQNDLQLSHGTMHTEIGQILGTLKYMSPEQARLDMTDVEVRSDIYALGVTMYELLTGETPLESEKIKGQATLHVLAMIREFEPMKPSKRLRGFSESKSTEITDRRNTSRIRLSRALEGDLDWIAMKAIEKDRSRRYESAAALADDVQRYLNRQTVIARPPTITYQLEKFVRRHRLLVSAASVFLVTLLIGIVSTTSAMWRARAAEFRERNLNEQLRNSNGLLQDTNQELNLANEREVAASAELRNRQIALERANLDLLLNRAGELRDKGRRMESLAMMSRVLRTAASLKDAEIENRVRRQIRGWMYEQAFVYPVSDRGLDNINLLTLAYWMYGLESKGPALTNDGSHIALAEYTNFDTAKNNRELKGTVTLFGIANARKPEDSTEKTGLELDYAKLGQWDDVAFSDLVFMEPHKLVYLCADELVIRDYQAGNQTAFSIPPLLRRGDDIYENKSQIRCNHDGSQILVMCKDSVQELDTSNGGWSQLDNTSEVLKNATCASILGGSYGMLAAVDENHLTIVDLHHPNSKLQHEVEVASAHTVEISPNNETVFIADKSGCRVLQLSNNPTLAVSSEATVERASDEYYLRVFPEIGLRLEVKQSNSKNSPSLLVASSLPANNFTTEVVSFPQNTDLSVSKTISTPRGHHLTLLTLTDVTGKEEVLSGRVWRCGERTQLRKNRDFPDPIRFASFSPASGTLYVGLSPPNADSQKLEIIPSEDLDAIGTQLDLNRKVTAVCLGDDGRAYLAARTKVFSVLPPDSVDDSFAKTTGTWRISDGSDSVQAVPNGIAILETRSQGLLTEMKESQIRIVNLQRDQRGVIKLADSQILSFAVGPESLIASANSDNSIRIWSANSLQEVAVPEMLTQRINTMAASRLSSRFAFTTADGVLHFRSWKKGELEDRDIPSVDIVSCMTMSSDGSLIAVGTSDGVVDLLDCSTGEKICNRLKLSEAISALAFTPNSETLFVGGGSRGQIWEVPTVGTEAVDLVADRVEYLTGLRCTERGHIQRLEVAERIEKIRRASTTREPFHLWP